MLQPTTQLPQQQLHHLASSFSAYFYSTTTKNNITHSLKNEREDFICTPFRTTICMPYTLWRIVRTCCRSQWTKCLQRCVFLNLLLLCSYLCFVCLACLKAGNPASPADPEIDKSLQGTTPTHKVQVVQFQVLTI